MVYESRKTFSALVAFCKGAEPPPPPPVAEVVFYPLQDPRKETHLYQALSYTWGGLEKPRPISIVAQILVVTENLYAALLHLRDCSLERIIWIDAICIDQEDLEEQG